MKKPGVFLGQQLTTSTGDTTTLTLTANNPATSKYVDFSTVLTTGDTMDLLLSDADGVSWEFGTFTFNSGGTLTRPTTPIRSTNSDASIVLSTGIHTVSSCLYPSANIPVYEEFTDTDGTLVIDLYTNDQFVKINLEANLTISFTDHDPNSEQFGTGTKRATLFLKNGSGVAKTVTLFGTNGSTVTTYDSGVLTIADGKTVTVDYIFDGISASQNKFFVR